MINFRSIESLHETLGKRFIPEKVYADIYIFFKHIIVKSITLPQKI